ncbi:TIGR03792 family protein [Cyanobacteria bacterium FACHB-DQ100]|uniref:TIGR03792 family protein n=1 Tax=unclassified Leptolyngbya TaxID=2650499 RepID=UPI00167FEAEC|nr:TIGR03792 family protein [Leptolyngbya sp. FACHB-17]MBD1821702.1 TIGR03792 family protein [Cyanobacteria bacterium FACHB-DQ100]MBD2080079.1 TIGR03792 family protein [Leptolyngbya sp. FACHB-17]
MVIEWLKVKVPLELRETYIQKDAEIWTETLSKYPGYVGKEIWFNPKDDTDLIMVIYWQTKDAWKGIPASVLEETDRRFTAAMGQSFPFAEEGEYQVRKFSEPSVK